MEGFVKAFLKASLVWLGCGVTLGLAMGVHPAWAIYRASHLHMNLLGFVAMMIFGVAYHVIPRFTGHPLYSRRVAIVHWWCANVGLALFTFGLAAELHVGSPAIALVAVGGFLSTIGAYLFILNIWRTIDGPRLAGSSSKPRTPPSGARRLPVYEAAS